MRIIIIGIALLILSLITVLVLSEIQLSNRTMPRHFTVGDKWTYKVVFPDSKSYEFTETVLNLTESNSTYVYTLFRDDAQHIITQYLWITYDWQQVKLFKPHIGNLQANSTVIYNPPVLLLRVPIQIGDNWRINSKVQTTFEFDNRAITSTELLREERVITSLDQLTTLAGRFNAFRLTVTGEKGEISEILWFDAGLGQVIYGEYYNNNEKVTETMVSYTLNTEFSLFRSSLPCNLLLTHFEPVCNERFSDFLSQVISITKQPVPLEELKLNYE